MSHILRSPSTYATLGGPVGDRSNDSAESGLMDKLFRKLVAPVLFIVVSGVLTTQPLIVSLTTK